MRPRGRAAAARAATRLALRPLRPSPRCPRDPAPRPGSDSPQFQGRRSGLARCAAGVSISLQDLPGDGARGPRLTRFPTLGVPRSRSRLPPAARSGGLPCSLLSGVSSVSLWPPRRRSRPSCGPHSGNLGSTHGSKPTCFQPLQHFTVFLRQNLRLFWKDQN